MAGTTILARRVRITLLHFAWIQPRRDSADERITGMAPRAGRTRPSQVASACAMCRHRPLGRLAGDQVARVVALHARQGLGDRLDPRDLALARGQSEHHHGQGSQRYQFLEDCHRRILLM